MRWRSVLVRGWRIGLLVAAVWLVREAAQRRSAAEATAALTAERVRDFFPEAVSLGEANPTTGACGSRPRTTV
ncbi:MAG TPA: hypothetical protein VD994_01470, partial [Prosthecobacter sp.]|nr:hypothetical protein [Prosthecobacter sp.]